MSTFSDIIAAYVRDYRAGAHQEQRWFAIQKSLEDAVSLAALAQSPSGKRLSHQRRIPAAVLATARRALLANLRRLKEAKSIEDLHKEVESIVGPIQGIGELYVYDTAVRISAKLGLRPKYVYVHAGVREGAKNCGFERGRKRIAVDELPLPFQTLDPLEIEDILCIYKGQLAGAAIKERTRSACFA